MEYFWKIPIFTEAVICLVSLAAKLMYGKCIFMQESLQNHLSGIPCSTSFFEKVDVISFIYIQKWNLLVFFIMCISTYFFSPEFLFGPYQSIINSKSFQLGWKLT